ncbi:unnamed protein product [Brassica rapa subsp. narinosa]
MAMRWSRRGKEIAEGEFADVKELLPERLFATDRFPNKKVNTTDYLSRVRNALNNTLEMAKLIGSCFGGLFKLPAQRLLMGRFINSMMTRQMWLVFCRKPLRFPLVGFGEVMGLLCEEFEDAYSIDFHLSHKDENYEYQDRLIGSDMYVAVVESETEMSGWRKRRLRWRTVEEIPEKTPAKRPKYHVWRQEKHMTDCIYADVYVDVANVSFSYIFVYISTVIYVTVV